MNILITGGAGFIGTNLIKKLLPNNKIIVFDNFLEQVHGKNTKNLNPNVEYIIGDVCNLRDWEKALEKNPDVIIHLASETGTGQSMEKISQYVMTNIIGTSNLIEILNSTEHNVKKIILSSSRAVYGESENTETNEKLKPKSIYGITKLTQESLITTSCKIPYTILRYQNVYGPGQSLNNPYTGIISIFSTLLQDEKDIEIYDNGKATRDFIFIDDVVNATELCIKNDKSDNKIYNVGTGIETNILYVTEFLRKNINQNVNINVTDYHRDGDILKAFADITKIQEELSWEPKTNLEEGLIKFLFWFKENKL